MQMDNLREMLRGKHKDSGEWVYGNRTTFTMNGKPISDVFLVCGDTHYSILYYTLGKCVGTHDKNGKPLFEDDMVKCKDGIGVIEWDDFTSKYIIRIGNSTVEFDKYNSTDLEIVGNTFDNLTGEG